MTKHIFRKPLALFLAILMVLGLFPAAAAALDSEGSTVYFKTVSSKSSVNWRLPYGEVTLKLFSKTQTGVDAFGNPVWNVQPVADTPIYIGETQAWTPDGVPAVTDADNGVATITLWGGAEAKTYLFNISAKAEGVTLANCQATMVYDGKNAPALSFSVPSANDTTLSSLTLAFPGAAASNGLPYVGARGMSVGEAVESVRLTAAPNASDATITATYQAADAPAAADYTLGEPISLAVGGNRFKLTVTNGADTQIYTLVLTRKPQETRNIPNEAAAVINGVKTVTGDAPYTDWILAMNAAGLSPTDAQRQAYLAAVLTTVDRFVDDGTGNPAAMAKIAIALTALGIDARQIPDPDGGEAIDLVKAAAAAYRAAADDNPLYSAPYLLSLYDLGNYEIPAGAAITRLELIEALLRAEADGTSWGYDGAGMVLPALAPYYNATEPVNGVDLATCREVTEAVKRALTFLSSTQTIDGGFGSPNSNTVSTVITGLSAIGINANTDSRLIKSGTSLLMNLLSFRTAEDKLGFADGSSADVFACLQGFQALAVWQNLSNQRSGNLYHFTKEIAPYTGWPDARLLTGIAVTKLPATVTYNLGAAGTVPDTAGIVVTATYNADASNTRVIAIADCTVSPIDCTRAGAKTVTVTYQGKTATFLVTVLDGNGTAPKQSTVSVVVQNGSKIIAKGSAVAIEAGVTSALNVLKTALDTAGKTYLIRNGSYVAEIDGLGEFDKGANAGWLYSVNGVTPSTTAAKDFFLSDGDTVLWYYTQDYTADASSGRWTSPAAAETLNPAVTLVKGIAAASVSAADMTSAIAAVKQSNGTEITIAPQVAGAAQRVAVALPTNALSDLAAQTTAGLRVQTLMGTVAIPSAALQSLASQAEGSTVTVTLGSVDRASLTAAQQAAVGAGSVFDISILSGDQNITRFGDHPITISLPYALKEREEASGVTVWYLDSLGKLQQMTAVYDGVRGLATFTTPHLSHYIVGYVSPWTNPFSDVQADDWFYGAVKYAMQKELFQGISASTFAPNAPITRSMLVTVLYRLEGKPPVMGESGFADVPVGRWDSDAVTWARTHQIVAGYGGGRFGASDSLSREQMAAILYRYARYQNGDVTKTAELDGYTDASSLSPWAKDAMKWANAEGYLTGTSPNKLSPADGATRAQAATILLRLSEAQAKGTR